MSKKDSAKAATLRPRKLQRKETGRTHLLVNQLAMLKRSMPDRLTVNGWVYRDEEFIVRVMAVADGWAMVRRPGCCPFVSPSKDIYPK